MKTTIRELIKNKRFKAVSLSCILLILVLGMGLTLALVTDSTNKLTNTFGVKDLVTHIEENVGTGGLKEPVVVNDGSATAFIRARVTVSPDLWDNTSENISLQLGWWDEVDNIRNGITEEDDVKEWSEHGDFTRAMDLKRVNARTLYSRGGADGEYGWYYCNGWFYFNQPVEVNECTTPLFDAVIIGENVKENFDVTIYQEAVECTPDITKDNVDNALAFEYITTTVAQAFEDVNAKE